MGASLTIFLHLCLIMYAYTKAITLVEMNDVDIMSALIEGEIDHTEVFSSEQGFFVAAALTAYDSETEIIEEERYGELIIEHFGWGYGEDDDDNIQSGSRHLDFHYCSDEELGIVQGPNTVIYPLYRSSLDEVKTYRKKFKCIPNEDLKIWGDYNAKAA